MATVEFSIGSMVRARNREWVVLPSDDPEILRVRPLGGTDDDACGLYLPLEGDDITSTSLQPPDARYAGNATAAGLLRDAVRLGFRSAAGPLRSIARVAVEPRPYQLVPLLMALRLDPVRLLIGDDVGIGKTIEAVLIARELLDRGEIRRLTVLCPPHLCEQWQHELHEKFHLDAVVVRPGTTPALERSLPLDRSLFEEYPITVVSIDFIKSDRRRQSFVQTCPEFVIVDEAHIAAQASGGGSSQQQRHGLLRDLAADTTRHMVLVTATPHSGDESAFASLIGLLVPELRDAIARVAYGAGTKEREQLARHFVQRRRGDINHYLSAHTLFPKRESQEIMYALTPAYRTLLEGTRAYTRELVRDARHLSTFHQRVRWWAALALLRCIGSSPEAAAVALRTRAAQPEGATVLTVDRLGQDTVLDILARDEAEADDSTPGADTVPEGAGANDRRVLLALARQAESISGDTDPKVSRAEKVLRELLHENFNTIVFCRYVATAHYVGRELARRIPSATIEVVTGELPAEERTNRVERLVQAPRRILVATDCLSEGVNLQSGFNAVVHYDLSWNPTRHEQREGRVDRYGQASPVVRTALLYGQDNPVDGAVLRVLLRKAETIRKTLGVSVPVPVDTNAVFEAIFEELLLNDRTSAQQVSLFVDEQAELVDRAWDASKEREQRTRAIFAQHGLKPEEVTAELDAAASAVGTGRDVQRFLQDACRHLGVPMAAGNTVLEIDAAGLPRAVRERAELHIPAGQKLRLGFELPVADGVIYAPRTHPLVEALAGWVADTAIAEPADAIAKRCGAIRTDAVRQRTVLLLLRLRFLIEERRGGQTFPMLAEECLLAAFEGSPTAPTWLAAATAETLTGAQPTQNVVPGQAQQWLSQVLGARDAFLPHLVTIARDRAAVLLAAHRRVRDAAGIRGVQYRVAPHDEIDLLGLYVLMPDGRSA